MGQEAEARLELGHALQQAAEHGQAMGQYIRCHELALAQGAQTLQARALLGMAKVDHALGDSELAAARLGEGAALATALNDASLAGDLFHQLGMAQSRLGHHASAEDCFKLAIERKRDSGELQAVGISQNSLGVLFLNQGNTELEGSTAARQAYELAGQHFDAALVSARACADAHLEALVLGNIGTVAGSLGDLPRALELFAAQLAAVSAMGDRQHQALALTNIGEAHRRGGDHAAALQSLNAALDIAQSLDSAPRSRHVRAELSRTFEAMGDAVQALHHFKIFHALDRQIRSAEADRRAALVTARFAVNEVRNQAESYRIERDRLQGDNQTLTLQAFTDPLTGLGNRRSFDRAIARALRRSGVDAALVVLDVDHFKQINDRFTHAVGDRVLQRLGALLPLAMRPSDSAFRIGGEEFCALLPGAGAAVAAQVCERLRAAVEGEAWGEIEPGLVVTASLGAAVGQADGTAEQLFKRADAALYAAKAAGRNRAVVSRD